MRRLLRQKPGPYFSEGARRLWLKCQEKRWSQSDLARELKTGTAQVSRWLYGERRPNRHWGEEIRKLFGIDPPSWDEPPTEDFVLPAAEEAQALAATGTA